MGFPHPDYLLECLTAKQLSDWEIIYAIEPFGEEAEWYRLGMHLCTIVNTKLKEGAIPFTPYDFMPPLYEGERSRKKQTPDDMKNLLSSASEKREKEK